MSPAQYNEAGRMAGRIQWTPDSLQTHEVTHAWIYI
jgi:hypothetical protein